MNFSPLNDKDKDNQLNEIIHTYRTKFWIDEHQWFVQCHWWISSEQNQSDRIELFNLPYSFSIYSANANYTISKSTCPSNSEYLIYKQVTFLDCRSSSSIASEVCFPNIKNLSISLPFNDQLLTHVPTLDRLTSITLYQDKDANLENIRIQLQLLLDRAPYLRTLYFFSWSVLSYEAVLLKITSVSVRNLYLTGSFSHDDEQYIELIRSPLGKQCETLTIKLNNPKTILDLVNNMPRLQSLKVYYENNIPSLIEDLRQQLPSTCSITRYPYAAKSIQLWIR